MGVSIGGKMPDNNDARQGALVQVEHAVHDDAAQWSSLADSPHHAHLLHSLHTVQHRRRSPSRAVQHTHLGIEYESRLCFEVLGRPPEVGQGSSREIKVPVFADDVADVDIRRRPTESND